MNGFVRTIIYTILFVFTLIFAWFISERFKAPGEKLNAIYQSYFHPCLNYWTTDPNYQDTTGMSMFAMKYYDKHEYALAIEAFQRFEPREADEPYFNLYLGICYLKTDFDNLAINHLDIAQKSFKDFNSIQLSRWYLSLAYLKAGRDKEALDGFNALIRINAKQRAQAEEIVDEIEAANNPVKVLWDYMRDTLR